MRTYVRRVLTRLPLRAANGTRIEARTTVFALSRGAHYTIVTDDGRVLTRIQRAWLMFNP